MFQNVNTIQIKGGCYDEGATLENILSQRLNIVYGRNGSGKSSLAKAIYDYAHNEAEPKFEMSFSPEVTEDAKARMFVYSEDFVLQNVKLATDGLEQIVMIGEQVDLSNKEDELKENLVNVEEKLTAENKTRTETTELQNEAAAEIEKVLKDKYAEREKHFKQMGRKPTVSVDDVTKEILENREQFATFDISQLIKDIDEGAEVMRGTKGVNKVVWNVPNCNMPDTLQACSNLLEKKVHQVELDERDQYLMSILSDITLSHYVDDAKKDIIKANAEICPLCQQPLTQAKREDLEAQIKRVLNKDAENYKAELNNAIELLNNLEIVPTAPPFTVDTYKADIAALQDAADKINAALNEVRTKLQVKTNDLFNSAEPLALTEINKLYAGYAKACEKLQDDVAEFNKSIDNRNNLEIELKHKNMVLAYLENRDLFDGYEKDIQAINQAEKKIKEFESRQKSIKRQIKDIESQRSQTKIAIDFINRCLSSVFFDRDRLELEQAQDGGKFILKSNGKAVAPDSVSTGERNIIGLAYFFARLYENTSESERYHQPYLVVIDDPITSYDQDNRLGVISLLKDKLTKLLVECDDSKVLIMSHDLRTVYLLSALYNEVANKIAYKQHIERTDKDCYVYELHNRRQIKHSIYGQNEYSQMLCLLYQFACDEEPNKIEYVGIGNIIRRILETFSMMMLNNSDYVRLVDKVKLYIPGYKENDIREVYSKYLTRIILNAESHSSTQIDQNSYEGTFTRESLQSLARYTLTFIKTANEQHLKSCHLADGWDKTVNYWNERLVLLEIPKRK